ncbi:hypothetical protein [Sulfuricurvum sp.]|uniref:hypothetical protein n=1 Tax=Sulfuricurvum sp. TaxID=2025608 RepID=UPI003562A788
MPTQAEINKDQWGTPFELFNKLDAEFHFTLDPCASPERPLRSDIKQFTRGTVLRNHGLVIEYSAIHRILVIKSGIGS